MHGYGSIDGIFVKRILENLFDEFNINCSVIIVNQLQAKFL